MEPIELVSLIIRGIIGLAIIISIGKNIFKNQQIKLSFLDGLMLVLILTIIIINSLVINSAVKILTTYLTMFFTYKVIYKNNTNKLLIGGLYALGIMTASDALTVLTTTLLGLNAASLAANTIISNVIVLIISILISRKLNIDITSISNKIKFDSNTVIAGIAFLIIIMVTLILFRLKAKNFAIDYEIITNLVLIILLFIVGVIIENDRKNSDKLMKKYTDLAKYTKQNENLLEIYRTERHENKNQLIIIKNMIENNDNNTIEYIDNLLEIKSKQINKGFICDLQYLTIPGLKGFINYKLQEMIDLGINVELVISKDIASNKTRKLTIKEEDELYNLVGIYLDNAKDAASESTEKIVAVNIYKEKRNLVLEIANTYSGNYDREDLETNLYSTKGAGHGYGLKIASGIISKSDIYSLQTEVNNGFFIQRLKISNQNKKKI